MTLQRQKPTKIDWGKAAKAHLEEEARDWVVRVHDAVHRRMDLHENIEAVYPAEKGERKGYATIAWLTNGKKIPWAPKGFLG